MVLHGDLCGVLHLIQILVVQLCQCRRGHGAGGADLRLTAALRAADGGVGLYEISDDSGDGDGEQVTPRSLTDMDDVGSMDEIQMLPEETDGEYTKMAGEMTSLEGMQEDEANEDDDEDADDDM